MKYILLSLFAVMAYTVAMTYDPEQTGYTKADRDGMDRLVNAVLIEQPIKTKKGSMSSQEQRAALQYLWGDVE